MPVLLFIGITTACWLMSSLLSDYNQKMPFGLAGRHHLKSHLSDCECAVNQWVRLYAGGRPVYVLLAAVAASVALRRTVNRGCVRRYANCPNQRRANTPHCAVPLKVCWISLCCLEALQRTTQTQSRRHESLPLFPLSLPLRSSRRPFFSAVEQTVHCCKGSREEVDAVAGTMKKHQVKRLSKFGFVFRQFIIFSF